MATKTLNFKLNEEDVMELKEVAAVYNVTMTDIVKQGVHEYIEKLKQDPFYRLTENIKDASPEETEEVLSAINSLSDSDLSISSVKKITL